MKRLLVTIISALLMATLINIPAYAAPPTDLASETAVLIDAETCQVLYNKDMDRRIYPASTTKILTALLVVENAELYEVMTVSETALEEIRWDSSHIALTPGEQLTVEEGLYALMLPSANDAANVLAEHVAGSKEAFAQMMTERAHEIGALNSNFTNAHGLHDDNHYTTAYDMALITRYAMNNPDFMVYFSTPRYTMPATNMNDERPLTNYQYMLVENTGFYNEDVIGGKVGFTSQAGNTMSTAASKDGRTLVCTVMNSATRDQKFNDTEQLLQFGFGEFVSFSRTAGEYGAHTVPVMENGERIGQVRFETDRDFSALIHESVDVSSVSVQYSAPDFFGRNDPVFCEATFSVNGNPAFVPAVLGSVTMSHDVIIPTVYTMNSNRSASAGALSPLLRIFLITAAAMTATIFILLLLAAFQRRKMLKRRRQRRQRFERTRREAFLSTSATYKPPVMRSTGQGPSQRNVYEYPSQPSGTQRKAR